MAENNNQPDTFPRNPFVALCDYASQNNWCWKIHCTTCGHGAFRISFSKIAEGQHPDDPSFFPHGKGNHSPLKESDMYGDLWGIHNLDSQMKLAEIVSQANLSDIQAVSKFPDWLGYIGLVITHLPSNRARMALSSTFIPQFSTFLEKDNEIKAFLEHKKMTGEPLSVTDLDKIEKSIIFETEDITKICFVKQKTKT